MEIDEIQKKEEKNLWYCQIYARKDFKNHIILQTVMTSLAMRTNVLIKPLLRNHLYQVQTEIKISHLEHNW